MLVSCSYCNGMHKRGAACQFRPKRKGGEKDPANYINRFRSTMAWRKKRAEIRRRDLELCQYCKERGIYTFKKLEVHHIIPISDNWYKRLDNDNLITLCCSCHKMADRSEINKRVLWEIIAKNIHS